MGAVKNLCKHTVLMERGRVKSIDETAVAIEKYLSSDSDVDRLVEWHGDTRPGDNTVRLSAIRILNENGDFQSSLTTDNDITVQIEYELFTEIKDLRVVANLLGFDGEEVFSTSDYNYQDSSRVRKPGLYKSEFTIPRKLLNVSKYYVAVDIEIPNIRAIVLGKTVAFNIDELIYNEFGTLLMRKPPGVIHPVYKWEVNRIS